VLNIADVAVLAACRDRQCFADRRREHREGGRGACGFGLACQTLVVSSSSLSLTLLCGWSVADTRDVVVTLTGRACGHAGVFRMNDSMASHAGQHLLM
jgi:hypothetical protein